jgi:hypothetical protein
MVRLVSESVTASSLYHVDIVHINTSYVFMFGWTCISNYIRMMNQHDVLFFSLFRYHVYMFQAHFRPSSRGQVYDVTVVLDLLVRRLSTGLDEKEVQFLLIQARRQLWNKVKISASCWFILWIYFMCVGSSTWHCAIFSVLISNLAGIHSQTQYIILVMKYGICLMGRYLYIYTVHTVVLPKYLAGIHSQTQHSNVLCLAVYTC